MCPGEDCYLFIGKPFQNSTLEHSTSGQGPLCKTSQYVCAVSEVRTQCKPVALHSLRTCNYDMLRFHSYHRSQTRALAVSSKGCQQCMSVSSPSDFSLWALGQKQFTEHCLLRAPQEIVCLKNNTFLPEGVRSYQVNTGKKGRRWSEKNQRRNFSYFQVF